MHVISVVSDIMRLSVAQVSPMTPGSPMHPLGSTMSMHHHQQRIETVADWSAVAKKYRVLVGKEEPSRSTPTVQTTEVVETNELQQQQAGAQPQQAPPSATTVIPL